MVKSATRVFEILKYVATHDGGCLHADIARALGIPRASLTALLGDLLELGYLTVDPHTRLYALGAEVLTLSSAYLRNLNIVRIGAPVLRDMFNDIREVTSLVITKDTAVLKVCEYAAPDPLAFHIQVGESGPMHASAGGKAILAHLSLPVRDELLSRMDFRAFTEKTITSKSTLLKELKAIRSGDVAYCREEHHKGMISAALPVFNSGDQVVAAITVTTPSVRFTRAHERRVEKVLRSGSARLSARLGNRAGLSHEFAHAS
jgi:DNA-binding IclR family transcriptional regulator